MCVIKKIFYLGAIGQTVWINNRLGKQLSLKSKHIPKEFYASSFL